MFLPQKQLVGTNDQLHFTLNTEDIKNIINAKVKTI